LLVTGGEFPGVLAALRALRADGYETWASAPAPDSYASRSRAATRTLVLPDAAHDPDLFVRELAGAARRHRIAGVLPGTERDLIALAGRESDFDRCRVGVPSVAAVSRAMDKLALASLAARAGLQIPPTLVVSRAELPTIDTAFPAVVKPARSESAAGGALIHAAAKCVSSRDGLQAAVDQLPGEQFVVQPYLPAPIYAVCGVAWGGAVLCTVHQRGLRTWPPDCGMVSYAETVPRDARLDLACARFVESVEWSGIFQLQFLDRDDGRLLIDFNPRVYISLALAVAAGLNLPAIWAARLFGTDPEPADYRIGARWRSDEDDPRAIAAALRRGSLADSVRAAAPRPGTVHVVFALRDPGPVLVTAAKGVRRLRKALSATDNAVQRRCP
jgi:predicted ATP-grasp superfamily ATP-dependent carboligase